MEADELMARYRATSDEAEQDAIFKQLQANGAFPSLEKTLSDAGEYPATCDPKASTDDCDINFLNRLLRKTEFADTRSSFDPSVNPCEPGAGFEVTPVQRFVGNFLHPRTPYMSMLLYHGVGVGKTCAAIQAAEAYLDIFPRRKVIIVAPPTIQEGFYRTIFNIENLIIGQGQEPNRHDGCTGNTYLKLTGCMYERDKAVIARRVNRAIERRYMRGRGSRFLGYVQFSNYIRKIEESVPAIGDEREIFQRRAEALSREFSYRMLIIDEAHNLRDVAGGAIANAVAANVRVEESTEDDADTIEKDEAKGGKLLTPYLRRLLTSTDGMKLLLMTATPMFNDVREIVHLLNLLLLNDKKQTITESDIFNEDGSLAPTADRFLQPIASSYISFMRGENPISFPLRLKPDARQFLRMTVDNYPAFPLSGDGGDEEPVSDDEKRFMAELPLVGSVYQGESYEALRDYTRIRVSVGGLGYNVRDALLQAGNCVFPRGQPALQGGQPSPAEAESEVESDSSAESESNDETEAAFDPTLLTLFGTKGFARCFQKQKGGRVRSKIDPSWLSMEGDQGAEPFAQYSPKMATILRSLRAAEGVCFVYSRFVEVGAFLLALALEANGYTPWDTRTSGFLIDGIQSPGGRQCALCRSREEGHPEKATDGHSFTPAKYILLTGDKTLSPRNAEAVTAVRSPDNVSGGIIKVVLGSQIASEGLDLKYIRENHILDAWFHLNKTEQIIGRAIRFCSHSLLPAKKRNATIFLHAGIFPQEDGMESVDLYSYRQALKKAKQMGQVSRKLKEFAVDCNLRAGATVLTGLTPEGAVIAGLEPIDLVDSQRQTREKVPITDTNDSAMCDWMKCTYECKPKVDISIRASDDSTYDVFSAQYRQSMLKKTIEALFREQPFWDTGTLQQTLSEQDASDIAIDMTLRDIVNNRQFRIQVGSQKGYILFKNGYFLFQPERYQDQAIPMAIRVADVPIKRDIFTYEEQQLASVEEIQGPEQKDTTSLRLWTLLVNWVSRVVSKELTKVTTDIETEIDILVNKNQKKRDAFLSKLKIILHLAAKVDRPDAFRMAVLQYIWDEWLTNAQKVASLTPPTEGMINIAEESFLKRGSTNVVRLMNPETGLVEYFCEGTPCPSLVVEGIQREKGDPVKQRTADRETTASEDASYGFLVPKQGVLIMKNQPPHGKGKKPGVGQECTGGSYQYDQVNRFLPLGQALDEDGLANLGLTAMELTSTEYISDYRHIFNNIFNSCALLDIILRYMDQLKVNGKRWFFRPLAAFFSGHVGKIQKVTAKTLQDAIATEKGEKVAKRLKRKPGAKEEAVVDRPPVEEEEDELPVAAVAAAAAPRRLLKPKSAAPTAAAAPVAAPSVRFVEPVAEAEAEEAPLAAAAPPPPPKRSFKRASAAPPQEVPAPAQVPLPEAVPEAVPAAVPEAVPAAVPEAVPEAALEAVEEEPVVAAAAPPPPPKRSFKRASIAPVQVPPQEVVPAPVLEENENENSLPLAALLGTAKTAPVKPAQPVAQPAPPPVVQPASVPAAPPVPAAVAPVAQPTDEFDEEAFLQQQALAKPPPQRKIRVLGKK